MHIIPYLSAGTFLSGTAVASDYVSPRPPSLSTILEMPLTVARATRRRPQSIHWPRACPGRGGLIHGSAAGRPSRSSHATADQLRGGDGVTTAVTAA